MTFGKIALFISFVSLAPASAARQSEASQPAPVAFAPVADHHLHLLSPAGAGSKLREAALPADLAAFVSAREKAWNDAASLETLFEPTGAMSMGYGWIEGAKRASTELSGNFTGPYRFRPNLLRTTGQQAQVWGFLVDTDAAQTPFGYFHWDLKKGQGSNWRIATESQIFPGPALEPAYEASALIKNLDEAGIRQGVVLSDAYYFALEPSTLPGELEKVRAENDWTAAQVAKFANRVIAFCSFNPLRDYALAELERCAASKQFKGVKLHLNAAQISFHDKVQVAKLRSVVTLANRFRLPLIVHVRSSNSYGAADAAVFLDQIVAAAPDVPFQIAHLWGGESFAPDALEVYAKAVRDRKQVAKHLYFDISGLGYAKPAQIPQIVAAIRTIGVDRILYASDGPPSEKLKEFMALPLTAAEKRAILGNRAPYLR